MLVMFPKQLYGKEKFKHFKIFLNSEQKQFFFLKYDHFPSLKEDLVSFLPCSGYYEMVPIPSSCWFLKITLKEKVSWKVIQPFCLSLIITGIK